VEVSNPIDVVIMTTGYEWFSQTDYMIHRSVSIDILQRLLDLFDIEVQ
jgi:hypothetical protein